MIFIDTNYFLRYFLKDIPSQYQDAKELFMKAATGKIKLFTSTIVFFELYWVLLSFYEKEKTDIIIVLKDVLEMSFVEIGDHVLLEEVVNVYQSVNFDLEDCYNLVYASSSKAQDFKTFDKKLSQKYKELKEDTEALSSPNYRNKIIAARASKKRISLNDIKNK